MPNAAPPGSTPAWSQSDSIGLTAWQRLINPGVLPLGAWQAPPTIAGATSIHDRHAGFIDSLSVRLGGADSGVDRSDDLRVFRQSGRGAARWPHSPAAGMQRAEAVPEAAVIIPVDPLPQVFAQRVAGSPEAAELRRAPAVVRGQPVPAAGAAGGGPKHAGQVTAMGDANAGADAGADAVADAVADAALVQRAVVDGMAAERVHSLPSPGPTPLAPQRSVAHAAGPGLPTAEPVLRLARQAAGPAVSIEPAPGPQRPPPSRVDVVLAAASLARAASAGWQMPLAVPMPEASAISQQPAAEHRQVPHSGFGPHLPPAVMLRAEGGAASATRSSAATAAAPAPALPGIDRPAAPNSLPGPLAWRRSADPSAASLPGAAASQWPGPTPPFTPLPPASVPPAATAGSFVAPEAGPAPQSGSAALASTVDHAATPGSGDVLPVVARAADSAALPQPELTLARLPLASPEPAMGFVVAEPVPAQAPSPALLVPSMPLAQRSALVAAGAATAGFELSHPAPPGGSPAAASAWRHAVAAGPAVPPVGLPLVSRMVLQATPPALSPALSALSTLSTASLARAPAHSSAMPSRAWAESPQEDTMPVARASRAGLAGLAPALTAAQRPALAGGIEARVDSAGRQAMTLVHPGASPAPHGRLAEPGLLLARMGAAPAASVESPWARSALPMAAPPARPLASREVRMPLVLRGAALNASAASAALSPGDAAQPLPPAPAAIAVLEAAPTAPTAPTNSGTVRHAETAGHGAALAPLAVDIDELVERTWRAVMTKLAIERERRGYGRWN